MSINDVVTLLGVLLGLLPVALKLFALLNAKSHNVKLKNLSERAEIIVTALDQSDMANAEKKTAALQKLAIYAQEVGIKVSGQQLDDYIESAVKFLKLLNNSK